MVQCGNNSGGSGSFLHDRPRVCARWILHTGVVLAFAPLLIRVAGPCFGFNFHVTCLQLLILGISGLGALWLGLRRRVVHVSEVAFPVLFLVGYPVRVISTETNPGFDFVDDVSLAIGRFSFTNAAYWEFTAIAVLGLAGLVVGQILIRTWCCRKKSAKTEEDLLGNTTLSLAVWWWFWLSVGNVFISAFLGVGSNGLVHAALPFRLTGLLFYTRTLIFPMAGMYLFGVAVEHNRRRQAHTILLLSILIGAASFPVTLSKASLLYAVAYLSIYAYHHRLSRKMVHWGIVSVVVLLPVTVLSVQVARNIAYSSGHLGSPKEIIEEFGTNFDSVTVTDSAASMRDLVLDRIVGAGELMAVTAGQSYSRKQIAQVLCGEGTKEDVGLGEIYYELYGLKPSTVDGVYNGKVLGLFGLLYLSHEPLLVFIVSMFLGALVLSIEDLFHKKLNAAAAAFLGFMISLAVWEGGFDTLRLYPFQLLAILVAWHIIRSSKRRPSQTRYNRMDAETYSTGETLGTCAPEKH
jgi:hypothetical protein